MDARRPLLCASLLLAAVTSAGCGLCDPGGGGSGSFFGASAKSSAGGTPARAPTEPTASGGGASGAPQDPASSGGGASGAAKDTPPPKDDPAPRPRLAGFPR
jgi:hypothetical protein